MVLGGISKMALSKWKKSLFFNSASSPAYWRGWLSRHASGYCLKIRVNFDLHFILSQKDSHQFDEVIVSDFYITLMEKE